MATIDQLRKEARALESEIDTKLTSYSKFGTSYAQTSMLREEDHRGEHGPSPESASLLSGDHVSSAMGMEIEQLLIRVCYSLSFLLLLLLPIPFPFPPPSSFLPPSSSLLSSLLPPPSSPLPLPPPPPSSFLLPSLLPSFHHPHPHSTYDYSSYQN
jgi:hypothetical protein